MAEPINLFSRTELRLAKAVSKAAIDLLGHMRNPASVVMRIPHTDPQLYVVIGDADSIRQEVKDLPSSGGDDCLT
jgi:hypothetical protein